MWVSSIQITFGLIQSHYATFVFLSVEDGAANYFPLPLFFLQTMNWDTVVPYTLLCSANGIFDKSNKMSSMWRDKCNKIMEIIELRASLSAAVRLNYFAFLLPFHSAPVSFSFF
jgi:hypothetical protein